MKINITPFHFKEILLKGYSYDHIILLKMIDEQIDLSTLVEESTKFSALKQSLIRKGLICENEDKLTLLGQELLVFVDSKEEKKFVKKKVDILGFEAWWLAFPSLDTFEYKGKKFQGCRTLRQNKEECRIKINKILSEGENTIEELIEALKYDVENKKEQSLKTNTNKLTYMQNSLTYLNQRSYNAYLELLKSGIKNKTSNNTYDGVNF